MSTIKVNPIDKHKDIIGKTFKVTQCEAERHGDNEGCVCYLIDREVVIEKQYKSPFVGTATFHIAGSDKRVRLSEIGLPNRMND